jgi:hypothetical protein
MSTPEPRSQNPSTLNNLALLRWQDVHRTLEASRTQAPHTGGPGHHTLRLSTVGAAAGHT